MKLNQHGFYFFETAIVCLVICFAGHFIWQKYYYEPPQVVDKQSIGILSSVEHRLSQSFLSRDLTSLNVFGTASSQLFTVPGIVSLETNQEMFIETFDNGIQRVCTKNGNCYQF